MCYIRRIARIRVGNAHQIPAFPGTGLKGDEYKPTFFLLKILLPPQVKWEPHPEWDRQVLRND